MNPEHRALCASERWATQLSNGLLPWALEGVPEQVPVLLELGPGPGAATAVLRSRTPRLLAVEFDADLATGLPGRLDHAPDVTVLRGDAAALPIASAGVDLVAAFTMLHHLPSPARQDQAFAEIARVLRPGGLFVGTDSLDSPGLRRLHHGDVLVPLDPLTLSRRLTVAGFAKVEVEVRAVGLKFRAQPG